MKKLFVFVFILNAFSAFCQLTITLRPDGILGKDALIDSRSAAANNNYSDLEDLSAWAFSNGGGTIARSLFQFNLTSIPNDAIIKSAKLSLFCNTTSPMTQLHSGLNACYIQRITSNWTESTVTWNNQPRASYNNLISLETSQTNTQNYLDIDVKQLLIDMVKNPNISFGFMLRLQNEINNKSMVFASSDHADPMKRPMLVITYMPACENNLLILQPNALQGKDALIDSRVPVASTNFGSKNDLACWSWTNSNEPTTARSLIQFDLSKLPVDAIISDANLALFCNTNSAIPQLHSGSNESYLERIMNDWNENTVHWMNQPSTISVNRVLLSKSDNNKQDYLNLDVTEMVKGMVNKPDSNFGFMLKLKMEVTYRSLIFASSDNSDSTLWPKLKICYTIPQPIQVISPNGGEIWFNNSTRIIEWRSTKARILKLEYSLLSGNNWTSIGTVSTNDIGGTYLWNVPTGIDSKNVRIRIKDIANNSIQDESDYDFTIINFTSLNKHNTTNNVQVFPNPNNGNFVVDIENNKQVFSIKLFNLNGQTVFESKETTDFPLKIDIQSDQTKAGIYLLEIKGESEIHYRKIFVY